METKSRTISQVHTAFSDNVACNRERKHAQTAKNLERTAHLCFSSVVTASQQDICVR